MTELTDKQKSILNFIDCFIKENGFSPSYRNIANNFLIWERGAFEHVAAIERKGYLKHYSGIARSFVVLKHLKKSR